MFSIGGEENAANFAYLPENGAYSSYSRIRVCLIAGAVCYLLLSIPMSALSIGSAEDES